MGDFRRGGEGGGIWGCTSMKGPDYKPELESDVWERAWSSFLQLLPPKSPSLPLSPASGLLWERSRQMAKWRRKKEEMGGGNLQDAGSL